jgi:hypothetical protein
VKPFSLLFIIVGSFAAGVIIRDQADDKRLAACQQHQERAVQFSTLVVACLNGYAVTDGEVMYRCKRSKS